MNSGKSLAKIEKGLQRRTETATELAELRKLWDAANVSQSADTLAPDFEGDLARVAIFRAVTEIIIRERLVEYTASAIGERGFNCDRPVLDDAAYAEVPEQRRDRFYSHAEILPIVRRMILDGFSPVPRSGGPQFEVLQGKLFPKPAGYELLLRRAGVTNIEHFPRSDYQQTPRGDAVAYVITFTDPTGKPGRLEFSKVDDVDQRLLIPKSPNSDAVFAKAKRRALAKLYEHVTGAEYVTDDAVEVDGTVEGV